jgi:hypothetical protein
MIKLIELSVDSLFRQLSADMRAAFSSDTERVDADWLTILEIVLVLLETEAEDRADFRAVAYRTFDGSEKHARRKSALAGIDRRRNMKKEMRLISRRKQ